MNGDLEYKRTLVGRAASIESGATRLGSTTSRKDAFVGAASVVAGNVAAGSTVAGNSARILGFY